MGDVLEALSDDSAIEPDQYPLGSGSSERSCHQGEYIGCNI